MDYDQGELNFSETEEDEGMNVENSDSGEEYDIPDEFQGAMERLKEVTAELEGGDLALEEAMDRYQEGLKLIEFCERRLEEAELLVEEIEDNQAPPAVSGDSGGPDDD